MKNCLPTKITLNANVLNAPIRKHRVSEWNNKTNPYICRLQETHFRLKNSGRLKIKRWEKVFHENGNNKKAGVAIHNSDKIDFKTGPETYEKMLSITSHQRDAN